MGGQSHDEQLVVLAVGDGLQVFSNREGHEEVTVEAALLNRSNNSSVAACMR